MPYTPAYYKELLSGFIRNILSVEQVKELYQWIEQAPDEYQRLMNDPELIELTQRQAADPVVELQPIADDRIREHLSAYVHSHPKIGRLTSLSNRWRWAAAAAVLLLGVATALIVSLPHKKGNIRQDTATRPTTSDVKAPERNRATVTLANGQRVALDSLDRGLLAQQGNVKLVKLADGRIAYQSATGVANGLPELNTLYNPRGSKVVDLVLSDGSHVWLNAGSSIIYPIVFAGKERNVSVAGEAYFEVSADASKPFYVSKGSVAVQVLGTHFNVNAYDDEQEIKVTLLQGSVKVTAADSLLHRAPGVLLTPGQQAKVSAANGTTAGAIRIIPHPNLEAVMAWKDGLFNFNQVSLQDAMRQLARWYDVDVDYQGTASTRTLGGEMQRDLNLSDVLDGLRDVGVHTRLEGKKLIVIP